jgi:predicted Zn-dependent peptidase
VIYGYDAAPAQVSVWIDGTQQEPTAALAALLDVLHRAAAKPLVAAQQARYVQAARGQWALETLSLDERAFAVGNAVTHGLDPDAQDAVPAAIASVTPADVQRVAKRYFQRFDVALIVPRSAAGSGS